MMLAPHPSLPLARLPRASHRCRQNRLMLSTISATAQMQQPRSVVRSQSQVDHQTRAVDRGLVRPGLNNQYRRHCAKAHSKPNVCCQSKKVNLVNDRARATMAERLGSERLFDDLGDPRTQLGAAGLEDATELDVTFVSHGKPCLPPHTKARMADGRNRHSNHISLAHRSRMATTRTSAGLTTGAGLGLGLG